MYHDPIVCIQNLRQSFSSKQLFQNFTVSFQKGLVSGVIGPNGSGKTTLLKLICGLIQPDEGIIEILGCRMPQERIKITPRMGVVLEGSRSLYWRLSGWENFVYFGGLRGVFGKTLRTKGEILFKDLQLWDVKDALAQTYSRGMQQKLAIICAFVSEPDLLILDEPTLSLDKLSQEIIECWIKKISIEKGKTVLLTSHQEGIMEQVCQKIISLRPNSTLEDNPLKISKPANIQSG